MKKIFVGVFLLICATSLFACDFSKAEQFGFFSHNGYSLTSFSHEKITFDEANAILIKNSPFINLQKLNTEEEIVENPSLYTTSFGPVLTEDQMKLMMTKYSAVTFETKYWEDTNLVTRKNTVYLTTYTQDGVIYYPEILKNNQNTIATGMVINNLILTPDLHDYYEQINTDFVDSGGRVDAPFLDMYSYDVTKEEGYLVLNVSDYSSNNSSITGNSTMEIHQTQAVYDDNNLMIRYQASFGISYATPGDTAYVGTVLEVSLTWHEMK